MLSAPVELKNLSLAPGERAGLVIDFAGHGGERIVVKSETFEVMQFRVKPGRAAETSSLPATLRPLTGPKESAAVKTRDLPLVEFDDASENPTIMLLNGMHWSMPVTENPVLGSVEIWNLINTTDDSHPIHLHLVRFQILDRRPFDAFQFQMTKVLRYRGPAVPPDAGETGWKDTVRAHPGMVTRIIVRFEGFTGRYVWHCHVLEHGDNEMMRPYEVIAAS